MTSASVATTSLAPVMQRQQQLERGDVEGERGDGDPGVVGGEAGVLLASSGAG